MDATDPATPEGRCFLFFQIILPARKSLAYLSTFPIPRTETGAAAAVDLVQHQGSNTESHILIKGETSPPLLEIKTLFSLCRVLYN